MVFSFGVSGVVGREGFFVRGGFREIVILLRIGGFLEIWDCRICFRFFFKWF